MISNSVEITLVDRISAKDHAVRVGQGSVKMTPSRARNSIKRALKAVIDPAPKIKEKNAIWSYFENRCAYCDCEMERGSRTGHIDHLIAEMEGGSNRLSNLVLTCGICNGDEKRDMDWQSFIAEKCGGDEQARLARVAKIDEWVRRNGGMQHLSQQQLSSLDLHFEKINSVLSDSLESLRINRN